MALHWITKLIDRGVNVGRSEAIESVDRIQKVTPRHLLYVLVINRLPLDPVVANMRRIIVVNAEDLGQGVDVVVGTPVLVVSEELVLTDTVCKHHAALLPVVHVRTRLLVDPDVFCFLPKKVSAGK